RCPLRLHFRWRDTQDCNWTSAGVVFHEPYCLNFFILITAGRAVFFLHAKTIFERGTIPMSTENKNIVRRLYDEVWNKRKLDLVAELISPSHALNDPFVSGSQVGPELYRRHRQENFRGRHHHSLHPGWKDSRLQCAMGCGWPAATARSPSSFRPQQGSSFQGLNFHASQQIREKGLRPEGLSYRENNDASDRHLARTPRFSCGSCVRDQA